jgi:hypothetical protein
MVMNVYGVAGPKQEVKKSELLELDEELDPMQVIVVGRLIKMAIMQLIVIWTSY